MEFIKKKLVSKLFLLLLVISSLGATAEAVVPKKESGETRVQNREERIRPIISKNRAEALIDKTLEKVSNFPRIRKYFGSILLVAGIVVSLALFTKSTSPEKMQMLIMFLTKFM